jgi:hypothetical protein
MIANLKYAGVAPIRADSRHSRARIPRDLHEDQPTRLAVLVALTFHSRLKQGKKGIGIDLRPHFSLAHRTRVLAGKERDRQRKGPALTKVKVRRSKRALILSHA